MLGPQVISFIATPLVAGVVGYITNKIAIKMLFRPYEPKWYTLGWQGIVPKTRPKLANKISEIVGQKLLAHDDFLYAIENNQIKQSINDIILHKLEELSTKDIYAIIRLMSLEDKIIANKEVINNTINNIIYMFIDSMLEKQVDITKLQQPVLKLIENFHIEEALLQEVDVYISNIINNDKTLKDILPESILSQKGKLIDHLTDIVMENIRILGKNNNIKATLTVKLIEFKNKMISSASGVDVLKAGFISMFISDEKITNVVAEELPKITNDLSKNQNIRGNIYNSINKEIDAFLNKNMLEIVKPLGINSKNEALRYIKENIVDKFNIKNKLVALIIDKLYVYNNLTIKEILSLINIDISSFIKIDVMDILNSPNYKTNKANFINKIINLLQDNKIKISSVITDFVIKLIKGNLKYALNALNIEKIVKDKINALPLPEVENILFSFMKEHFKWINILGFFIGFIIGLIQVIVVFITG